MRKIYLNQNLPAAVTFTAELAKLSLARVARIKADNITDTANIFLAND